MPPEKDAENSAHAEEPTLDQRWLKWLRNQPVIAVILVLSACVVAVGGFWESLPREWTGGFIHYVHRPPGDGAPASGWVFAGYVEDSDPLRWTTAPRVAVTQPSGATYRPYIIRIGDVVEAQQDLHQVIIDYRTKKTSNQLAPPWKLHSVIKTADDWTGRVYPAKSKLEVLDVSEAQFPGQDVAVWIRVQPLPAEGDQK